MQINISEVTDKMYKAEIVQEILMDLPEWFGLPENTQAYMEEAKELKLLAATTSEEVVGFLTMRPSSESCMEIHAMGVKKSMH